MNRFSQYSDYDNQTFRAQGQGSTQNQPKSLKSFRKNKNNQSYQTSQIYTDEFVNNNKPHGTYLNENSLYHQQQFNNNNTYDHRKTAEQVLQNSIELNGTTSKNEFLKSVQYSNTSPYLKSEIINRAQPRMSHASQGSASGFKYNQKNTEYQFYNQNYNSQLNYTKDMNFREKIPLQLISEALKQTRKNEFLYLITPSIMFAVLTYLTIFACCYVTRIYFPTYKMLIICAQTFVLFYSKGAQYVYRNQARKFNRNILNKTSVHDLIQISFFFFFELGFLYYIIPRIFQTLDHNRSYILDIQLSLSITQSIFSLWQGKYIDTQNLENFREVSGNTVGIFKLFINKNFLKSEKPTETVANYVLTMGTKIILLLFVNNFLPEVRVDFTDFSVVNKLLSGLIVFEILYSFLNSLFYHYLIYGYNTLQNQTYQNLPLYSYVLAAQNQNHIFGELTVNQQSQAFNALKNHIATNSLEIQNRSLTKKIFINSSSNDGISKWDILMNYTHSFLLSYRTYLAQAQVKQQDSNKIDNDTKGLYYQPLLRKIQYNISCRDLINATSQCNYILQIIDNEILKKNITIQTTQFTRNCDLIADLNKNIRGNDILRKIVNNNQDLGKEMKQFESLAALISKKDKQLYESQSKESEKQRKIQELNDFPIQGSSEQSLNN